MGHKGRHSSGYDSSPVQRLRLDQEAMEMVNARISDAIQGALEAVAAELAAERGLPIAAAELLITQQAVGAVEFARWAKAGQARAAHIPARGIADAMGYSSQTSLFRFLDTIDAVAYEQAHTNDARTPRELEDSNGYRHVLQPVAGGMDVHTATLRGYNDRT